jgi:succinoglycan biosynthesis protein ExoM
LSNNVAMPNHHISVCICTFKRADLLRKVLTKLEDQQTGDLFTYSVVVADNDAAQSAEPVVTEFLRTSSLRITYCVEPQQNIAMVRNKALASAEGDFMAFIDDDEFPGERWLFDLFNALNLYSADGILGPVKPYFETEPPQWIVKGKFFDRIDHPTGYKLSWPEARTGNVLFKRSILDPVEPPFNSAFDTAGEDVDFFRRMMEKGCSFVWCSEAAVHEVVPPSRCTSRYMLRRALLRGSNFPKHGGHRFRNAAKSLLAVPSYTLALPVLAVFGKHVFVKYLIKLCDHGARLLAHLGLHLVTQRET